MTIRAIAGLAALNLFVLSVGAALLWALRGWRWWSELLRLAGVAYLLGVASFFVALTFEIVVGIPLTAAAVVTTGLVLGGGALGVAWIRGRRSPGRRPAGPLLPRLSVFGALFAAAILVYLEAAFRAGRLAWLFEWDAWRVWTIRAKDLYFAGSLDPELMRLYPPYPPGFSSLQASAFHAMGSADVVTVHLQQWFVLVGFVGALVGLLAPRVRQEILLPVLRLLLVMPSFTERVTWALADLTLAYLVAVAALLLVLWLEDRQSWRLAVATVLMGGALLTKREGILVVACLVAASISASWQDRRRAWPRLAASALVAVALALPWRIWIIAQELPSDGPEAGYLWFLDHTDRAWPALELVARTFVDSDLWLVMPVVAVTALAVAVLAGARQLALFAVVFLATSLAASTWTIWANPSFSFTQDEGRSPVVRLDGTTVVVLGVLTPLMLERAWRGRESLQRRAESPALGAWGRFRGRGLLPWAIVVAAALAYPGSMVVGYSGLRLPGGPPPFPSADDCVQSPAEGSRVRVVFGYESSYPSALALRARAVNAGFQAVDVAQDGCGRLRVYLDDLPSVAVGRAHVSDAEAAGLDATVEADTDA
jgi:hypothetical protein